MADNETLVSWRFDMDKFSDHLCEWVPVWVCYLGPRPGDLGPAMQPHDQLLAQKTIPENEPQIGSPNQGFICHPKLEHSVAHSCVNMNMCMIIDTFTNTGMNLSMKTSRGHNAACISLDFSFSYRWEGSDSRSRAQNHASGAGLHPLQGVAVWAGVVVQE